MRDGPKSAPDQASNPALTPNPSHTANAANSQSDGNPTGSLHATARDDLRKQLATARRQLTQLQVLEYSSAICQSLISLIEPAANVAGYLALGNEVRLDSALSRARQQQQCKTYVPIVQKDHQMIFAQIDDETALIKNKFGISEPDLNATSSIPSSHLDVVFVPLVGFDEHCQRMGMGGGFYDRAFAANKNSPSNEKMPLLIGVAYDIQKTTTVLPDWWDVPLDIIVTESGIIRRVDSNP